MVPAGRWGLCLGFPDNAVTRIRQKSSRCISHLEGFGIAQVSNLCPGQVTDFGSMFRLCSARNDATMAGLCTHGSLVMTRRSTSPTRGRDPWRRAVEVHRPTRNHTPIAQCASVKKQIGQAAAKRQPRRRQNGSHGVNRQPYSPWEAAQASKTFVSLSICVDPKGCRK